MGEDFNNHRRIFDACPEPRRRGSDDLQAAAQFGQCSMSVSKTRLSSVAQLMRACAPCAGACALEGSVAALADAELFCPAWN